MQKITDAANFIINKEDHTLGNVLRMQLSKNKKVLFTGYKAPHPLEHYIELRVQTTGDTKPRIELQNASRQLITELNDLKKQFEDEVAKHSRATHQHHHTTGTGADAPW